MSIYMDIVVNQYTFNYYNIICILYDILILYSSHYRIGPDGSAGLQFDTQAKPAARLTGQR